MTSRAAVWQQQMNFGRNKLMYGSVFIGAAAVGTIGLGRMLTSEPAPPAATLHVRVPNLQTRFVPSGPRRRARITFEVEPEDAAAAQRLSEPVGRKLTVTVTP